MGRTCLPGMSRSRAKSPAMWRAVPPSLHLGQRELGLSVKEALVFRSRTQRQFTIVRASVPRGGASVEELPEAPGAYSVEVRISKLGEQVIPLEFTVRESNGLEYQLLVAVRYLGVR